MKAFRHAYNETVVGAFSEFHSAASENSASNKDGYERWPAAFKNRCLGKL
jgi:hypothetical protein